MVVPHYALRKPSLAKHVGTQHLSVTTFFSWDTSNPLHVLCICSILVLIGIFSSFFFCTNKDIIFFYYPILYVAFVTNTAIIPILHFPDLCYTGWGAWYSRATQIIFYCLQNELLFFGPFPWPNLTNPPSPYLPTANDCGLHCLHPELQVFIAHYSSVDFYKTVLDSLWPSRHGRVGEDLWHSM